MLSPFRGLFAAINKGGEGGTEYVVEISGNKFFTYESLIS
jgi:hypothetical protein